MPVPLIDRFWTKVRKDGPTKLGMSTPCWRWTASKRNGYGQIGSTNAGVVRAHRLSWEIHFGPIGPEISVCHKCDNPECTNPEHLFLGGALANVRDAVMKGRRKPPPERKVGSRAARNTVFGQWLAISGFTDSEVARAIGRSRQAVNSFARGERRPSTETQVVIEELSFGAVSARAWPS